MADLTFKPFNMSPSSRFKLLCKILETPPISLFVVKKMGNRGSDLLKQHTNMQTYMEIQIIRENYSLYKCKFESQYLV